MKKLKESTVWIIIWILIYLAGFFTNIYDAFSNHGIHIINGQYYRFFTGLLLHTGLIHILGNILGIYFTGKFLDHQISQWKLLLITVFSATSANAIFSVIAPNSISVGGSPIVFSLIGLVCVSQFLCKDTPRFHFRTQYGEWIVGYAILSNISLLLGNFSILIIHLLPFFPPGHSLHVPVRSILPWKVQGRSANHLPFRFVRHPPGKTAPIYAPDHLC